MRSSPSASIERSSHTQVPPTGGGVSLVCIEAWRTSPPPESDGDNGAWPPSVERNIQSQVPLASGEFGSTAGAGAVVATRARGAVAAQPAAPATVAATVQRARRWRCIKTSQVKRVYATSLSSYRELRYGACEIFVEREWEIVSDCAP